MAAVYQARDTKRQTICAIKEMSLSTVPEDERVQAIQNFKSEAHMLWGLNHANLPAFYGFFSEGPRYFMVMEYIDGYTLEEWLEQNNEPFSERRVLGWARQLCDVLEYLHTQNPPIIFRDMKPGNVMVMRNQRIKLIDFGIARLFRSAHGQDTQLLGTPGFAPPEQYGKAQTDERSDIYSLAITLYQLLTNIVPDGFGLKDIRAINPQISPSVARALEKAASLAPEERYENVAAFRRALLGVGTFMFENGDQATTPEELADLCARYPEEASDYLVDGEIESWLRELGENELAREARHIRALADDPLLATEQFIQAVMGPQARLRGRVSTSGRIPVVSPSQNGRSFAGLFARKPASVLQVTPRTIDFGAVYPGISAPLSFTIAGRQGAAISGTLHTNEQWIMLDQTQFDGMSTRINVRVNTGRLTGGTHYSGTILIEADDEDTERELVVTVDLDVIGYTTSSVQRRGGKTFAGDLDDEDDDDLTMGGSNMTMLPPTVKTKTPTPPTLQSSLQANTERDEEYKAKYGSPSGTASSGWDPLRVSPRQRLAMQRGLTFTAAFMLASLCYTVVAQLPSLAHQLPLFPNPWLILVLCLIIPAATIGALLVYWEKNWTLKELLNRAATGMGVTLIALALVKISWQAMLRATQPMLQLLVLLVVGALVATMGAHPKISASIMRGTTWALRRMSFMATAFSVIIGASVGFALTTGMAFSVLTILGVLVGMGVGLALVLRADALLKHNGP